jgi:UDP:flavonoid glycosyltransferase YjiC (YdhE family)
MAKRVLIVTTGSLGDLHPYLAIGLELLSRGAAVTIATNNYYRTKVERTGLGFTPMGPHIAPVNSEVMQRAMDLKKGAEYLLRQIIYPGVPAAYAEVMDAVPRTDIIVTHPLAYAAQIAAEKTGLPWISTVPTPTVFFSRFDPPVLAPYPFLTKLRPLGPDLNGLIIRLARATTKPWMAPISRFRASLGLVPGHDPLFEGQHSPQRVLALFSRVMAEPQPDWPPRTLITGFAFYDQFDHGLGLDPELQRFLDAGPAPVVFTLGSAAVMQAGAFYKESLAAIRRLGCRAVLLAGDNSIPEPLPLGTVVFPYAPFSKILPRASVVVHPGGIGTTAQALVAGRPMLVVPYAFDQPDNAARVERLGVARVIRRKDYTARRVTAEVDRLLSDTSYGTAALEIGSRIKDEDGVRSACDVIDNHRT